MRRVPLRLISVVGFVALWALLAHLADSHTVPSPGAVGRFLVKEAWSGDLFYHLSATLGRVAAAFIIAMLIGSAIGVAMGQNRTADRLFDPWVILAVNMPALVTIVLSYIWLGLTEVAAIAAVAINKIPNVIITVREGTKALDSRLTEMARVFRFSRTRMLWHVVLPQLQPYIVAAGRSGLALIWKIVLVVEFLGRSNGVGFQIHLQFQLFNVTAILAYAFAFIIVMLAIEFIMVQPLEKRLNRWRPKPA